MNAKVTCQEVDHYLTHLQWPELVHPVSHHSAFNWIFDVFYRLADLRCGYGVMNPVCICYINGGGDVFWDGNAYVNDILQSMSNWLISRHVVSLRQAFGYVATSPCVVTSVVAKVIFKLAKQIGATALHHDWTTHLQWMSGVWSAVLYYPAVKIVQSDVPATHCSQQILQASWVADAWVNLTKSLYCMWITALVMGCYGNL